jgi:dipeptidyl-peptidase-4
MIIVFNFLKLQAKSIFMIKKFNFYFLTFGLITTSSLSQTKKSLSIKDAVLYGRTSLAPQKLNNIQFLNNNILSYSINNNIIFYDCKNNKISNTLTLSQINNQLKTFANDTLNSLPQIHWLPNKTQFSFSLKNKYYIYDITSSKIFIDTTEHPDNNLENLVLSSNPTIWAYTKDFNLYIHYQKRDIAISNDGNINLTYGYPASRNEFGINEGAYFSPSAEKLALFKVDHSEVADYPIIHWTEFLAKSENIKYPMAGQKSQKVYLGIYHLKTGKIIYIQENPDDYKYLTNIAFTPDEKYVLIAVLNRDQNYMKLNMYSTEDGKFIKTLFEEKDDKYVEPLTPALFLKNNPSQFIWRSNRDGYYHLYLYDLNGKLIKQLTKGEWEVKKTLSFSKDGKKLFFLANAESPINQDIYSIDITSGNIEKLSKENGFHNAIIDDDGNYLVDSYTSCYVPAKYFVTNIKTKQSNLIFESANPLENYITGKWKPVELKSFDGTTLYGRIFYPVNFDSTKKYPVLVYLYNGPHLQLVTNTWMMGGEVWYHYMLERGFIVFTIDGHGTPFRGKKFEQTTFRQLGQAEMKDQLIGVEYLKSLPYVDDKKLAVFGWSFGGFMTLSLMTHYPDVFKVAVAGGPVVDWSYYEVMYTERYMDTPQQNPDGFKKTSILNSIQNLKGKLLVIHGAEDDVVVWQHSMMLLKTAIDKGIQLDYFVYPTHKHNVIGKDRPHLIEKVCNYIIENIEK